MTADEIIKALGGKGTRAVCPACERERENADSRPTLSVETSASGKVLLHCFYGCPQEDVIAALRDRGLWGGSGHSARERKKKLELAKLIRRAHSIIAMAEFETAWGNEITDPYDRADIQKAQRIVAVYPDVKPFLEVPGFIPRDGGFSSLQQTLPHYFLDDLVAAEAARDGVELYEDSEQYGIRATAGITSAW